MGGYRPTCGRQRDQVLSHTAKTTIPIKQAIARTMTAATAIHPQQLMILSAFSSVFSPIDLRLRAHHTTMQGDGQYAQHSALRASHWVQARCHASLATRTGASIKAVSYCFRACIDGTEMRCIWDSIQKRLSQMVGRTGLSGAWFWSIMARGGIMAARRARTRYESCAGGPTWGGMV